MGEVTITVEEFERRYARRSSRGGLLVTVEQLHEAGMRGRPCNCGADDCQGWQMIPDEVWAMRQKHLIDRAYD